MNEKKASLEVIGPTIEEAIEMGLDDLGLSEEDVEVEVLDEGSRGLFGLGSRQARIRLTIRSTQEPEKVVPVQERYSATPVETRPEVEAEEQPAAPPIPEPVEDDFVLATARSTVIELLEKMRVQATVTASYGEPDEARNRVPVHVQINGDDLSILIGRRAETLNALQYIAALIISKEIGRSLALIVDVEGYRQRREQQLRQLARRMADQAINSGRRQALEPMTASERRIIHIELRGNPEVETESVGEEPRRKVTIIPK